MDNSQTPLATGVKIIIIILITIIITGSTSYFLFKSILFEDSIINNTSEEFFYLDKGDLWRGEGVREKITSTEGKVDKFLVSPTNKYTAVQELIKEERVACCGSEEPNLLVKNYRLHIINNQTREIIKRIDQIESFSPTINKWESDDILKIFATGILEGVMFEYIISEDKLWSEDLGRETRY